MLYKKFRDLLKFRNLGINTLNFQVLTPRSFGNTRDVKRQNQIERPMPYATHGDITG